MKKIFACSPYKSDTPEGLIRNIRIARGLCRHIAQKGHVPIAPHLIFTQFLNENDPTERIIGINCGLELLKVCDELWWYSPDNKITPGMEIEIEAAGNKPKYAISGNFYLPKLDWENPGIGIPTIENIQKHLDFFNAQIIHNGKHTIQMIQAFLLRKFSAHDLTTWIMTKLDDKVATDLFENETFGSEF